MEKTKFDFWKDHSEQFLKMALQNRKNERLENADGVGKCAGACGDSIEVYLCLTGDRIETVSYYSDGCLHTNACANTMAHLAENKTIKQAWEMTPESVVDYLQTLPKAEYHCAEMAIDALQNALTNLGEIRRNSWKKLYR